MTGSDRYRMKKPHEAHACRVAEHAWKGHHPIRWQETSVIDRASRSGELRVTEAEGDGGAAHPSNTGGSALQPEPGCWPETAWLLGFHYQGIVREAMPTTIGLDFP